MTHTEPDADGPDHVLLVEEQHDQTDSWCLTITGEIDIATVPTLRAAIVETLKHSPTRIVFDLDGVRFIDSSGLAALLEVASTVKHIEILHPSPAVRRVIELAGLASVLPITP